MKRIGLFTKSSHGEMVQPSLKSRGLRYAVIQQGAPEILKIVPDFSAFVPDVALWREAIVSLCQQGNVEFVFANGHEDNRVVQESTLAEPLSELGIPFLGHAPRCAEICLDKWKTRQVARSLGIPCTPGSLVSTSQELKAVLQTVNDVVFVKELVGWAGQGNKIFEPTLNFVEKDEHSFREPRLVEHFIDGLELGVTVLRVNHKVYHFPVALKGATQRQPIHALEKCRLMTPSLPQVIQEAVQWTCEQLAHALDAKGWLDFEFILSSQGLLLLEVNARISGLSRLTAYSVGSNLYDIGIAALLGEPIHPSVLIPKGVSLEIPMEGRHSLDVSDIGGHLTYTRKPFRKPTRLTVWGQDFSEALSKVEIVEKRLDLHGLRAEVEEEFARQVARANHLAELLGTNDSQSIRSQRAARDETLFCETRRERSEHCP